jgi:hypothetical protein
VNFAEADNGYEDDAWWPEDWPDLPDRPGTLGKDEQRACVRLPDEWERW